MQLEVTGSERGSSFRGGQHTHIIMIVSSNWAASGKELLKTDWPTQLRKQTTTNNHVFIIFKRHLTFGTILLRNYSPCWRSQALARMAKIQNN